MPSLKHFYISTSIYLELHQSNISGKSILLNIYLIERTSMINFIKSFFSSYKSTEPVPAPAPAPVVESAPYKVPEPAATTPIPLVVEPVQPVVEAKVDPVAVALDLEPLDLSTPTAPAKKPRKPRAPKAVVEKPVVKKAAPKKVAAIKAAPKAKAKTATSKKA
jgi:hypothetical protein